MKYLKKLTSIFLIVMLVLMAAMPAMAATTSDKGSITITSNSKVGVAGRKFKIYKIMDVEIGTNDAFAYTIPSDLRPAFIALDDFSDLKGDEDNFDAVVTAKIAAFKSNSDKVEAFVRDILKQVKKDAYAGKITTVQQKAGATDTTLKFADLSLGYYVIEDITNINSDTVNEKVLSALGLTTTDRDATVMIKADPPTIDKVIDGEHDTDEQSKDEVKHNRASVGDWVPYIIKTKVPDMTGYTKYDFIVVDTLSKGLSYVEKVDDVATYSQLTVKVGNKTLTKDTDYTVSTDEKADSTLLTITFNDFYTNYKNQAGEAITITYQALVNGKAVIGTEPNTNSVILKYTNDPDWDGDGSGNDPDGVTPESVTKTYITGIKLIKVDAADPTKTLEGAQFEIKGEKLNTVFVSGTEFVVDANGSYYKLTNQEYTTTAPKADGSDADKYESTEIKYTKNDFVNRQVVKTENVTYTAFSDANGNVSFTGLNAGTYTITELIAPNGYNLLKDPIEVVITGDFGTTDINSDKFIWQAVVNKNEANPAEMNNDGIIEITVENVSGQLLPETGGAGTTLIYILGGALIVGAGAVLVLKKKKEEQ